MEVNQRILSDLTVFMKYAKFLPEKNRRETWEELVDRNKGMHLKKFPELKDEIESAYKFVYDKKVLPSMRSLQFAGKPIEINPARMFNCAYLPIDDWRAFSEVIFLLLGGTGIGFSVQRHHVDELPEIIRPNPNRNRRWLVSDNIEGWADAIKALMKSYFFGGSKINFDYSDIRAKGVRLITSGGKAPGPQPLKECITKIEGILETKATGEKLTSIEVHDIVCHLADAVLAGGIRRAALISLFNADDDEMISCKSGSWWELNPQRGRANNSAVLLRSKLTEDYFLDLWKRIELSGAGEPGIFLSNSKDLGTNPCCFTGDMKILTKDGFLSISEVLPTPNPIFIDVEGNHVSGCVWSNGYKQTIRLNLSNGKTIRCTPEHRFMKSDGDEIEASQTIGSTLKGYGEIDVIVNSIEVGEIEEVFDFSLENDNHWGVIEGVIAHNCEISLRPNQVCNLTEVNVSNVQGQEDLNERVKVASFIGTLQASYTDFHYLRPIWKKTTEKDALIGVSMTGIASGAVLGLDLKEAAQQVKIENARVAKLIGIRFAARNTNVKPAGTSSLVLSCSSGIHAWYGETYLRRIRVNKNEAIYTYLSINHPELVEDEYFRPHDTAIIQIPVKSPPTAILRNESPIDLLERIKHFHSTWIAEGHRDGVNTHNVSATVSIKPDEWEQVGNWMWENREHYTGLSVLPYDGGTYIQAPFEDIDEETFQTLSTNLHDVDLSKVVEMNDETDLTGELACSGNSCEIK